MFKYKLQPVLDHRRMVEDEAKRRFQLSQNSLERALHAQRRIADSMTIGGERIRQAQRTGMDFRLREIHENWFESQRRESARVAQTVAERTSQAESLRLELVETTRRVKILEKLRDRQRKAWQREEDRREQHVFDEIAVREFNQRRGWEKDAQLATAHVERNAS